MPGATYVLDKTYKIVNSSGVGKYIAVGVSAANNDGECDIPGTDGLFCYGITQEAQLNQNENVLVRMLGISRFVAEGALTPGTPLMVEASTGSLKAWTRTVSAAIDIVGFCLTNTADGAIGFVFLTPGAGSKTA